MLVKRYHAKDMQQAMDTVLKELGPDAVILNSRKIRKKGFKNMFKKPIIEVMVAYDPEKTPAAKKLNSSLAAFPKEPIRKDTAPVSSDSAPTQPFAPQPFVPKPLSPSPSLSSSLPLVPPSPPLAPPTPPLVQSSAFFEPHSSKTAEQNSEHLNILDKRIDSIDEMLSDFVSKFSHVKRDITYDYPDDIEALLCKMLDNQVEDELAHKLAREAEQMMKKQPEANAMEIMEHLILENIGKPDPIEHKKFTQKIILVFGATGVGKTTTIVKLAADFSVKQRRKIGIINTDTYRIGAQEQLTTYSNILETPLEVIYDMKDLAGALEKMSDRDIIFIDTAGKRPGDEQHKKDIQDIINIANPEDLLLCLSASTSFATVRETVDAYKFIDNYRLMVTKLDETKYRGILLNICWYTQKTLAYVTTGQNVPDDIETINVESIADQILRQ